MTFRGVIANVLPPPRRPVTLATAAPLIGFLAAFGATCAWLELSNTVEFTQPGAFAFMTAAPWIWWMGVAGYAGLARTRGTVALVVRLTLLGAFAMALASPRSVRTSDVLAVVYAVDVSDSVGEGAQEAALEFMVRTASEKPEADRAGLVVFGRDAGVEFPPRRTLVFEGSVTRRVSRDGTDLEKALSLAAAVLPEEHAGRIVLVSDGVETEGSLSRVLDDLRSREVPVDVLPVGYTFPHEVWLERLDLPKTVKVGEAYEASVVLSSLQAGSGKLVLRENGQEIFADEVEFGGGKNRYSLPLRLRGPGYYEYLARIEVPPSRDGWAENNVAVSHLYLEGEGRVLLVTDPAGDPRDWRQLERALKAAERLVERMESLNFPRDAMSLMPYDCVVLANVPADAFDAVQQEALRSAVFNQGTGFLMVGGKNSFGPGGYNRTPVEEALPVTMDVSQRKVMPKGALAIVLHTCEFADGNTWGKEIAKAAMRVLSKEDEVGVLVFSWEGGAKWLFKLTPASEYERLVTLVNKAEIGDMPDFGTTMKMGLAGLKASDAAAKHMIIISDGDPQPPTPKLLQEFVSAQVSVSTVAINPHGGQDVSIMNSIASATGGRYYFAEYAEELPSIFIKEAKTLRRSMIQNKDFTPTVQFPSPILKGIDALPGLHGYVLTTPKPRSATILEGPEEEDLDPVLATWRYGLGKSAAWTSDLSPNWGRDWVQWGRFRAFVKQLMVDVSRVKGEGSL
ncbi:MAG: VWA domain-containing protein, partial [Planctomycetota bacterium]